MAAVVGGQTQGGVCSLSPKILWRGAFNLRRQVFIEYVQAYSERQAWLICCRRIAKKTGVHVSVTMGEFDGSKDNFVIAVEKG